MDKSKVFRFLLAQADQGDLEYAKDNHSICFKENEKFKDAIDEAMKMAPPAGTRNCRFGKNHRN